MTTPGPLPEPARDAREFVRDVFGAAWTLFQVSLPTCLPLAVVAVVASGVPGREAAMSGEPGGHLQDRQWWGVTLASSALVLICYGAMLHQQLGFAAGARPQLRASLNDALREVPAVVAVVAAWVLPFLPAMASTAWRGFDWLALLLTTAGAALVVPVLPAWPALIAGHLGPRAALATSIGLVRGRWPQVAAVVLALLAGILVFVMLSGILIGMVMYLAGQGANPTAGALAFSRWLIALVLAAPVVHAGAVAVMTYRSIHSAVISTSAAMK